MLSVQALWRIILFYAISFLTAFSVLAQTDKVDEFVRAQMRARKIPGVSIAVVRNGEVVAAKGYGLAMSN